MLKVSTTQLHRLGQANVRAHAALWTKRVDEAVPPRAAADPAARIAALAREVLRSSEAPAALVPLVAADLRATAAWLVRAVETGVPYREARAAALLNGAAALGAMWFMDDRLVAEADVLPIRDTFDATLSQLLAEPQGWRFQRAAAQERLLRAPLRAALRRVLAAGLSPASVEPLVAAAFPDALPEDVDIEDAANHRPEAANRFLGREQPLLVQSGVTDPGLQLACAAGDLVLGLGRCARFASEHATRADAAAGTALVRELLDAVAGLQQ